MLYTMRFKSLKLFLLTLLSWKLVEATTDCESCQMTRDHLSEKEDELLQCKNKLSQLSGDDNSYLGQLTSWISQNSKSPAAATSLALRALVSTVLKTLELDIDPAQLPATSEVDLNVVLTKSEVVQLQRHLLAEEGTQAEVLNILANIIQGASRRHHEPAAAAGYSFPNLHFDDLIVAQTVGVSVTVLACLLWGVAVWKVATIVFVGSWSWTWCHLYQLAVARKQATLLRLGDVPKTCLVERQGWLSAVRDLVTGGGQAAKCEAYYEVTPVTALTEMASQFVLRPLNVLGKQVGAFYTNLLEPLPWVWKLPVLILATLVIIVLILIAFRYKFNFGFNLFSLEPCQPTGNAKKVKDDPVPLPYENDPLPPYNTQPNLLDNLIDNRFKDSDTTPWKISS